MVTVVTLSVTKQETKPRTWREGFWCGDCDRFGGFMTHNPFPVLGSATLLLTFQWDRISSWRSRMALAYNAALTKLKREVPCKFEASPGYIVPGQPGLHYETLSKNKTVNK